LPFTLISDPLQSDLSRFRVLVLADLALISDELLSVVRSYVQQGGGLVMTGQATRFDEHSYRRKEAGLADLFAKPLDTNAIQGSSGKGLAVYVPEIVIPDTFRVGMLPRNHTELLKAVNWAANGPLQITVEAPETVSMSLYSQPSGLRILHLVNYDKKHPAAEIAVTVQLPSEKLIHSVTLLSPDFEGTQTVATEQSGRRLHFVVPRLEIYDLLVIG
ncbi:MAG: hypothetical protein ACREP9_17305, partial [Candidatus Dormibacteraceae bacterium]